MDRKINSVAEYILQTYPEAFLVGPGHNVINRTLKYIAANVYSVTDNQHELSPSDVRLRLFNELQRKQKPCGYSEYDMLDEHDKIMLYGAPPAESKKTLDENYIDTKRGRALAKRADALIEALNKPGSLDAQDRYETTQKAWFKLCTLISIPGYRYRMSNMRLIQLVYADKEPMRFDDMQLWEMPVPAFYERCEKTWGEPVKNKKASQMRLNALDYIVSLLPATYVASGVLTLNMGIHLYDRS